MVALGVPGRGGRVVGGAVNFFAGVKDLEGEDGEAVDHESGGLGVERGVGIRQAARSEIGEEGAVELFGKVVSALVGGVDAALDAGEDGIGSAGGAGFVFDVPEIEVGAVVGGNHASPDAQCCCEGRVEKKGIWRVGVDVPLAGEAVVEFDDLGRGENRKPHLHRG